MTIAVSAEGYEDASFEVDIPDPTMAPGAAGGDYPGDPTQDPTAGGIPPEASGDTALPDAAPPGDAPAGAAPAGEPPAMGGTGGASNVVMEGDQMVVSLSFPLKAKPKKGTLLVRTVDDNDAPIAGAAVKIAGASEASGVTNEAGDFTVEVDPGAYTITAEKEGYFRRIKSVEAALDSTVKVKMPLSAKPLVSSVEITKKRINIKKKVHFETNSDQIKAESFSLLDEVADLVITHTELELVQIQGHTDNKGKRAHNVDLSQRRAESVRRYLVEAGVAGSRLESKGFGPDRPRAPNITAMGRAKNRRVEFHILNRAK
jgi:outer membrane protein OmpA-like peptidoglycan-associated protein